MRIGKQVVAGCVVAMLAGCGNPLQVFSASPPGGGPRLARADPHRCDQGGDDCRTIIVNPGEATWVKDPIVIFERRKRNLVFEVVPGYEFVHGQGIVVSDDTDRKYDCKPQADGRKYKCEYTNRDKFGMHKYTINVKSANGTVLPPYDPFFINE